TNWPPRWPKSAPLRPSYAPSRPAYISNWPSGNKPSRSSPMKTTSCAIGLALACLTLLAACAPVQPSLAPQTIRLGCPAVVPCTLPATSPQENGDLLSDADITEAAWAECAAQVDAVYRYQVTHEQARLAP